ncbi:major facilitator superfamily domain-containing protein [Phaeosphaeriaceae sp. PMI808]|nr:major facilitator superfamily domain-containing protein [Phaeosphaeriaceae sp. PMI808]
MNRVVSHSEGDDTVWAPGTVRIGNGNISKCTELVLHPVPSSDPDDPLNWSTKRKAVNFSLLCFYVLWTFVQLDIGFTAWGPMQDQLGFTTDELNIGAALNYGGLAIGCIFFMPFVHKYGRRPLYLFSSAAQLASVIWQAETHTSSDLIGSNIISGLSGAISETIVQITIADIFFVHQHGTVTGVYLMCTSVGAFLGPVASGYIVDSQGWRWMWWWCVIFMALNLILVIFFFEETKYIPAAYGHGTTEQSDSIQSSNTLDDGQKRDAARDNNDSKSTSHVRKNSTIDHTVTPKTYRQRLALVTTSKGSVVHHLYQPIIVLFTFPAVTYTALTYGTVLSSFAIMTSVQATYLLLPPYNFSAAGVGLMNVAPFVGAIFGFVVGGYFSDKSIMRFSQKNQGIYEPEMRLRLAFLATFLLPTGILMVGLGLVRGLHWAVLAVGLGLFGFAFVLTGDITLAYTTDCYQDIIGDALVGIVFFRNAVPLLVLFVLTPWIDAMGVQGVHIITAAVCFVVLLFPVALLKWGKKARISTSKRYEQMALRQPVHRTIGMNS